MADRQDDPDFISRAEVARLLGCHASHVPRLEAKGELKVAWRNPKGTVFHSRTAVLALLNRWVEQGARTPAPAVTTAAVAATVAAQTITPEQARAVFVAFREKRTLGDIVEATGLLPDQVRALYQQYQTPLDAPPPPRTTPVVSARRIEDDQRADREYQARMRDFESAQQERRRRQDADEAERRRRMSEMEASRRLLDQQRAKRISDRLARLASRANRSSDRDDEPIDDPDHTA